MTKIHLMSDLIIYYFLGILIVSNLICVWKFTNLSVHMINIWFFIFRKKDFEIYTTEEFENHMAIYWGWLGELLICPLCLSTHLSWITSLIFFYFGCVPITFLAISAFSWPMFAYLFYCIFNKISN